MAGSQEVKVLGYQLKAQPKARCRRIIGDFWPYWQASKPSFEVIVNREGEDTDEREVQLFIVFPNGDTVDFKYLINRLKKGGKDKIVIPSTFLGFTGDTTLIINSSLRVTEKGIKPHKYLTLYSFHVTPKAWVSLAIMAGLIAGVFTTIWQLLIRYVN
ncbi:hypothetical protein ACFLWD_00685 [Chloroflexota bacterium]